MSNNQFDYMAMWVPADNMGRPIPPQAVPLDENGKPIPPLWVLVDAHGNLLPQPPVKQIPAAPVAQQAASQEVPQSAPQAAVQEVPQSAPEASVEAVAQESAPQATVQAAPAAKVKKAHGDAEGTVGKIVMAVLASIFLVFSLGIFALVVFPDLTELAKLLVITVISFIFFATGMVLTKKKPENKVFLTILFCGVAMVYTSNMIYYGLFSQILFFAFLPLWAVATAFVMKKRSKALVLLAQIANVASGLFVLGKQSDYFDVITTDAFLAVLAMVASVALFFVVGHEEKYYKNWMNWAPAAVAAVGMIAFAADREIWTGAGIAYFVVASLSMILAIVAGYTCYWLEEKRSVGFGIYNGVFMVTLGAMLNLLIDGPAWIVDTIMFVVMFAMILAAEKRLPGKYAPGKMILFVLSAIMTTASLMEDAPFSSYSLLCVFVLLLLVCGFVKDNRAYRIAAIVISVLFLFTSEIEWLHITQGIVLAIVAIVFIYRCKDQYKAGFKIPVAIMASVLPLIDFEMVLKDLGVAWRIANFAESALTVLIISAFCLIPAWGKHPVTKAYERPTMITNLCLGAVGMLVAMDGITSAVDYEMIVLQIVAILVAILQWMGMTIVLFRRSKNGWFALIVGILWASLLLGTLGIYAVASNIISIVGIVYAIGCIVVGFMVAYRTTLDYAPLRILGLGLVIFSLLKLLIWDIDYSGMLARAISFFLAGILCLAISLIYSFVEKKVKKEKQEQNEETAEVSEGL